MTDKERDLIPNILGEEAKGRLGILNAVSNWLKLLALVVLVAEVMIIAAMKLTPPSHPLISWYPLFMLLFLVVVVVGVFVDRFGERTSQTALTLALGDRKISVDTSQTLVTKPEMPSRQITSTYSDSQKGFMFPRPKSSQWSEPQHLDTGSLLVKVGLLPNLESWNQIKEAAAVIPLGKMLIESNHVLFQYGEPLDCELTDDTSTTVVDTIVNKLVEFSKKEGGQPNEKEIRDLRKSLVRGNLSLERFKVQNTFSVSISDKALAQDSPVVPNLGNIFLTTVKQTNEAIDELVANEDSILWGSRQTLKNVLVNGSLREVTVYRISRLLQSDERVFNLSINFSPQTEASISVWEELKEMFNSFRVVT